MVSKAELLPGRVKPGLTNAFAIFSVGGQLADCLGQLLRLMPSWKKPCILFVSQVERSVAHIRRDHRSGCCQILRQSGWKTNPRLPYIVPEEEECTCVTVYFLYSFAFHPSGDFDVV